MLRTSQMQGRIFGIVAAIARCLMTTDDATAILGDSTEDPIARQITDAILSTATAIRKQARRHFYPALAVREAMTSLQRYTLFCRLYAVICRMNVSWMIGYYALVSTNTQILPDVYPIDTFGAVVPGLTILLLLLKYRDGYTLRPRKGLVLTISPDSYRKELKSWQTVLLTGVWYPISSWQRSFLEGTMFIWAFFVPGYALLEWYAGKALARGTTWFAVWLRLDGAFVLLVLWICLRKANQIVADILKEEIQAVDRAGTTVVSE
jgi:hypothetical protein